MLWLTSGMVISGIEVFSRKTHLSKFIVSALILGVLTSITEISVGINALLESTPTIYAGNLIGGSFVILLCIVPLLAIFNRGIILRDHLDSKHLFYLVFLLFSPSLLILDGFVSRWDAILLICLYVIFLYILRKKHQLPASVKVKKMKNKNVVLNLSKIVCGAVGIFFASKLLVSSTIYIADTLQISKLFMSLIIMSIGTNIPEIVVAVKTTIQKTSEVAFGNYIGSAIMNPLLFGIFTVIGGGFSVQTSGLSLSLLLTLGGYILFFLLAKSKATISLFEGLFLFLYYVFFILIETSVYF